MMQWIYDNAPLVIGALGFAGVLVTQWTMFCVSLLKHGRLHRRVDEVNDAVNHRHRKTDDASAPKLYDLAWENRLNVEKISNQTHDLLTWMKDYRPGPLDSGQKVRQFVEDTNGRLDALSEKVDELKQRPACMHYEPEEIRPSEIVERLQLGRGDRPAKPGPDA